MTQKNFEEKVTPKIGSLSWLVLVFLMPYLALQPFGQPMAIVVAVALLVATTFLIIAMSPRILLTAGELQVGSAVIERKFLGDAKKITAKDAAYEKSHGLSSLAFTRFQASVPELVKVTVKDPKDRTTYWLFSTKKADELVKLLNS